jgi:signal transduction histidine kinase
LTIVTPMVLMVAVIAWVQAAGASLPDLVTPVAVQVGSRPDVVPSLTPLGVAIQIFGAVLFGSAALVCRELWHRDRSIGDAYVAFGLVLASFAQLFGAISPSTHPGPVASGDLLRLGFDLALLLAIEREARSTLGALRRANRTLELMRESEVGRAAMDERSLLSRELHDGLAQDLWLAKLKIGRLAAMELAPETRSVVDEVSGAIELGLAEARQAVMALRIAADSDDTFAALMARYLDDFQDRFGLRVEFDCGADLPTLPVRTQAELLRIAQEALTNAYHHADATVVRVRAQAEGDRFRLSVVDNGRGFDQEATRTRSFGLAAMRERAALIGAVLEVRSAPGDGTRIRVTAPLGHVETGASLEAA